MATFVDLMLENDAIEYIGTLNKSTRLPPRVAREEPTLSIFVPHIFEAVASGSFFCGFVSPQQSQQVVELYTFGAIRSCWYVSKWN